MFDVLKANVDIGQIKWYRNNTTKKLQIKCQIILEKKTSAVATKSS